MEFEGERTFDLLGKGDPIVKLVGRRVYIEVSFGIEVGSEGRIPPVVGFFRCRK